MRIEASRVARITGGQLVGPEVFADGIAFDSRTLNSGQAFVAIVGESDGHDFLASALNSGASFAIVHNGRAIDGLTCIEVPDTVVALALVARELINDLPAAHLGRVIGITGSAGKTSTKDFVRVVLEAGCTCAHAASGSLNNDIGVPITILNAPDNCDAIVLEMGMRGFGEITRLCEIAAPNIGVLTNIGDAHGDRVGGISGVAKAKFELVESLPKNGVAILNADDAETMKRRNSIPCGVVSFGSGAESDVRWEIDSFDANECATVSFSYLNESVQGFIPFPGMHMVANAAAAVAVGLSCGMQLHNCVEALADATGQWGRMVWRESRDGMRILDDSYNANSGSMMAALQTLAGVSGRKVAVLGAMSEIPDAVVAHRMIAEEADLLGIELLALETDLYGVPAISLDEVVTRLSELGTVAILVKGSRVSATERVVQALL